MPVPLGLLRKTGFRQGGEEAQGVFVVEFFQHGVGEIEAVEFPDAVVFADGVEVFVVGFQKAEVDVVFGDVVGVFAEEDAVLVFR